MKISPHFTRQEFACRCGCGFDAVDIELVMVLEDVRRCFIGSSIRITSPCRCPKHNTKVGGSKNSKHMQGTAADFQVVINGKIINQDIVADYLIGMYPDMYGIGRYNHRTHIDMRATKARWDKR